MECRLCLEINSSIPIFNINIFLDKIRDCCGITIITDNGLPDKICTLCRSKLNYFIKFKRTCEQSEEILKERLKLIKDEKNDEQNVYPDGNNDLDVKIEQELYVKENLFKIEDSSQLSFEVKVEYDENEKFPDDVTNEIDIKEEMPWISHNDENSLNEHISDETIHNPPNINGDSISVEPKNNMNNRRRLSKACCKLCNKVLNKTSMSRHMRLIHKEVKRDCAKTMNEIEILRNQSKCDVCDKIFCNRKNFRKHLIVVHKVMKIKYIESDVIQMTKKCENLKKVNRPKKVDISSPKSFMCPQCFLIFDDKMMLIKHKLLHKNEPFECDICHKTFTRKEYVKRHIDHHTKIIKKFPCNICGHQFLSKSKVRRHILNVHEKIKEFQCNICGKLLGSAQSYRIHSDIHSNTFLYNCDYCGKTMRHRSSLRSHIQMHLGIKPHKCDICSKRFALSGTLKSHMLQHTGENPFSCNLCDRTFKQRCNLKSHMRHYHKKAM